MKFFSVSIMLLSTFSILHPPSAHAALPACETSGSDVDGDGFGWENGASCRVTNTGSGTSSGSSTNDKPFCIDPSSDPDGDGYGWENNSSCIVGDATTDTTSVTSSERPACSSPGADPDGDGYGWENNATCVVDESLSADLIRIVPVTNAYPYKVNSPYAEFLNACAFEPVFDPLTGLDACQLSTVSYLGHVNQIPTVGDIMNRVLVTHDWMGRRFEQLMHRAPPLMRQMFGSVAVIAIGSDVEFASFAPAKGLLQIDPRYLWLSVDEKRSIDFDEAEFARTNDYIQRFFTRDGQPIPRYRDYSFFENRNFDAIIVEAMYMLFHELSHAVDFVPQQTVPNTNYSGSTYDTAVDNIINDHILSPQLQALYPSGNAVLKALISQSLPESCDEPTVVLPDFDEINIGQIFSNDGAASYYSYCTTIEDFAELVATAMIKYEYGVSVQISFEGQGLLLQNCRIFYNRLGNPYVALRAEWAVRKAVNPGSQMDSFFATGIGDETQYFCNY